MIQTELHRHVDVSFRLTTLHELAARFGLIGQSESLEAFRLKLVLSRPLEDLASVLARFEIFQRAFDRPETIERVAYEAVEDCWREGTRQAELRFAPSFVCEYNGLSWEESLDAMERGLERAKRAYPGMKAGLICIAVRDDGPDGVARAVEFFLKHAKRFIGLDLAGNESDNPCRLFETAFRPARASGAKITIHAGEGSGPENVWEAIELLGAKRIGHGLASLKDPELVRHLAEKEICLEMCPTSNIITRAAPSLGEHPLPKLLRSGVPVTINTDDPAIFGVDLPHELALGRTALGLTERELESCKQAAAEHTFL